MLAQLGISKACVVNLLRPEIRTGFVLFKYYSQKRIIYISSQVAVGVPKCFELQPPHLYTQLHLKPSDIHSSLRSYVLCIGILFLRSHFQPVAPLNIPYPHFPWGFDAPNTSSALAAVLFETQARPSHHWAFSHDSQKCMKWRSYKARSLLSFYAYSKEERNGHPVPPKHFYSWAQTQPCWFSSCGWTSTPVPPFLLMKNLSRKDIAGSHTMKLKVSCCK